MDDMKNYYQQRREGFTLVPCIYAKTVKEMRCYPHFVKKINALYEKNELRVTENDVENAVIAERYVKAIDKALKNYVEEDYRDAVFDHVILAKGYHELEEKYYFSVASIKRRVQRFVFGVAKELGEDFK